MRFWLSTPFLIAIAVGCGRVEEPRPTARPEPAARATSTSAHRASPERCVVPTADEAAPRADPAPVGRCPRDPDRPPTLPRKKIRFAEAAGQPEVDVEVAHDDTTRQRGLMYRTQLAEGRGMLFSWDAPSRHDFWMHNTCIPLDMLFVAADGTIAGVVEQVPVLNDAPRGVACPSQHVIEVPAGYTRAHGIKAGQRVTLDP